MALNFKALEGARFEELRQSYDYRDTLLYALSLGVGAVRPFDASELIFCSEKGAHDLQTLPMMAVTLAPPIAWMADPQYGITYHKVVHGEQYLTIHRPLPVEGAVISRSGIERLYDKGPGRGAIAHLKRELYDEASGELIASMLYAMFLRADGGFRGREERPDGLEAVPIDRAPDIVAELPVSLNQALLYRLTGDTHPLHADPAVAQTAGFDIPILHGLCAYGMVGRAAIEHLCGNDASRLRQLNTRFTGPVFPGEALRVEIWNSGPGTAAFRLVASEREAVVEDSGYIGFVV